MGYSPWGHKESDTTEHTHTLREAGGGPPPELLLLSSLHPLPGSGAGAALWAACL